ncbi:MAG: hypothetical protein GEV06_10080 [Luteitalea sp.]|nr:hypothetical protein [Luteitalea sp.]
MGSWFLVLGAPIAPMPRRTKGQGPRAKDQGPQGGAHMHVYDGRTRVLSRVVLSAALFAAGTATAQPPTPQAKPADKAPAARDLEAAVDRLGDLDYEIRTDASSLVRRAPAEKTVPMLTNAARSHKDGYVRFRALVLLAGLNDPKSRDLMAAVLTDENDRLREVAYRYFEEHPDPALAPRFVAALKKETSEFVRPPLTRALAAHGGDPTVQATLKREVMSGQDYFRSGVIEALGDHKAAYALPELLKIAQLEGPLQDDAVLALGRIGDKRALDTFARLQRTAPREQQPAIAAAICMLGVNCQSHQSFLAETLRFASKEVGFQPLLRATADSLAELAITDHTEALQLLFETVVPTRDPVRAPLVLAVGSVALRNPQTVLGYLSQAKQAAGSIDVLREAFDMLEEDYAEERFYATVRRTFWSSPESSAERKTAQTLIGALEF